MLRRVPGRVQQLEAHLTYIQQRAVVHGAYRVTELGAGASEQLHVGARRQLANPGQVVVVLMGVARIADAQTLPAGFGKIGLDVAAHVEHQRLAGLLGSDQIGRVP
jgi:hypothetical protein